MVFLALTAAVLAATPALAATPTTVVVTSSPNPGTVTDAVTFTATVSPSTATGTVQFKVDGSNLSSPVTLSGGVAKVAQSSNLSPGTHTVTASYSGDGEFEPSTGTLAGGHKVDKADPSVELLTIRNSAQPRSVSFEAKVFPTTAGGTVQFKIDGSNLGTPVSLQNGVARSETITNLATGNHNVVANYSGDANFNPASRSITVQQAADKVATATSVVSSPNPGKVSDAVTFTATVTPSAATGAVQFKVDGSNFGSSVTVTGGLAKVARSSNLSPGTHTVVALYSGDGNFEPSSGTLSGGHKVTKADPSIELSTIRNSAEPRSVRFEAAVFPSIASGSVQFRVDGANLGAPVGLQNGVARSQEISNLATGSHTVVAEYSGDANFTPASRTITVAQVGGKANTTTSVSSRPNPGTVTDSLTFTANVTPSTASGTVQFKVDGADFGSPVALSSGVAAIARSVNLPPGTHEVVALYSGDNNHHPSTGTLTGRHKVSKADSSIELRMIRNSAQPQSVSFEAEVLPSPATGTVQFGVDGSNLGAPVALHDGVARSQTIPNLATGNHTIVAEYSGDANRNPSSRTIIVEQAPDSEREYPDLLPRTGFDSGVLAILGLFSIGFGVRLVRWSRGVLGPGL